MTMKRRILKIILCITVTSLAMIYFGVQLLDKTRRTNAKLTEKGIESVRKVQRVTRHNDEMNNGGLPSDYFQRDYIEDNNLVDKLVPLLKSNIEVINEIQRIQINMLKKLIGKFKYAMLLNFAAFENKGDPAITAGELHTIRKLGIEMILHCETYCKRKSLDIARNLSKQYTTEDLVILMHGGGNLLSYLAEDHNRQLVLEHFPDFNVIMFPQSLWNNARPEQVNLFQTVYSRHKNLTFLYRDRNSYNLGKQLFPKVKCYLMPDMAFQVGAVQRFIAPTHDVIWLQRGDTESTGYEIPTTIHGYDVIVEDWWEWKTPRTSSRLEDTIQITANGMMFLQRGRIVITDRLHGHILCVLCGIPHVVLDPVNRKISSFMQSWTGGIDNVRVAHSAEEALELALQLLSNNKLPELLSFRNSIGFERNFSAHAQKRNNNKNKNDNDNNNNKLKY